MLGAQHVCNNGSMVTDVLAHRNGKEAKIFRRDTTSYNDIEWCSGPLPSAGGLAAGSCPTGAAAGTRGMQEEEAQGEEQSVAMVAEVTVTRPSEE